MSFESFLLEDADEMVWKGDTYNFSEGRAFPFAVLTITDSIDAEEGLFYCKRDGSMHAYLYDAISNRDWSLVEVVGNAKLKEILKKKDLFTRDPQGNDIKLQGKDPFVYPSTIGRVFVPDNSGDILISFWELDNGHFKLLSKFWENPPIEIIRGYGVNHINRAFIQYPDWEADKWQELPIDKIKNPPRQKPKLDLPEVKNRIRELQSQIHLLTGPEKRKAKMEILALNKVLSGKLTKEEAMELIDSVEEPEENEEAFGSWQYGKKAPLNVRQRAITSESLNT